MAEERVHKVVRSAEDLQRELEDTRALLDAGHSLAEISRRRPGVLIALAQERPLSRSEAIALRRWFEAVDGERSWAEQQVRNARAWCRLCAELGNALGRIAEAIGEPGLEQDPDLLVARTCERLGSGGES